MSYSLKQKIKSLARSCQREHFEAGYESRFSEKLCEFFKEEGYAALEIVHDLQLEGEFSGDIYEELLRVMTRFVVDADDFQDFFFLKIKIVQSALCHYDIAIRDSAVIAIRSLDYPIFKDTLLNAIRNEPNSKLKEDMCEVLSYLSTKENLQNIEIDTQQVEVDSFCAYSTSINCFEAVRPDEDEAMYCMCEAIDFYIRENMRD